MTRPQPKPRPNALHPIIAFVLLLAAGFGLCGCHKSETAAGPSPGASAAIKPWFEEITDRSGLRFKHEVGPGGKFFMPETVGSGCAIFDYDNDGRMDIYLVQNAGPGSKVTNKLFHQEPDGRFRDVSAGS